MSEEPTERDDGPYEGWSIPAIIHNYVVIRGDLSEQYARDQLADLIAYRIAQARRDGAADELDDAAEDYPDDDGLLGGAPHWLRTRAAALRGDA